MVNVASGTDPVEMLPPEARSLAAALVRPADELDQPTLEVRAPIGSYALPADGCQARSVQVGDRTLSRTRAVSKPRYESGPSLARVRSSSDIATLNFVIDVTSARRGFDG
jgi:hypothetical protein